MQIGEVLTMAEYIEREAAYKDFEKCNSENPKWTPSRVKTLIARQKAADVAPVRHGRWVQVIVHVEFEDGFVDRVEECCSACHEPNGRRCTYFCPNCGCKMDLEE